MFDDFSPANSQPHHDADYSPALIPSASDGGRWAPRVQRVGATLRSLILFCCGGALLITAAMVLDPGTLLARVKTAKDDAATAEARREFTDSLAALISQCHQVLAIHQRGATPPFRNQAEIVLWRTDDFNPGQIDPEEVAIISHSDLLQAVTLYQVTAPTGGGPANLHQSTGLAWEVNRLNRVTLQQPGFCDRWRALPVVQPRVLGSGISDMKLLGVWPTEELSSLRLWLRWAADSSDATETYGVIAPSSKAMSPQRPMSP